MFLKYIFPFVLQLLGVIVLISEFFIPSGGFLSILAFGLLGYSLYAVFTGWSASAGYAFILADLIIVPLVVLWGVRMIARSKAALRAELSSKEGYTSESVDLKKFAGKSGTTVSLLRPSGIALIDNQRVDVVTGGEFIGKGVPVEVINIIGNQIIVKEQTKFRL